MWYQHHKLRKHLRCKKKIIIISYINCEYNLPSEGSCSYNSIENLLFLKLLLKRIQYQERELAGKLNINFLKNIKRVKNKNFE